MWNELVMSNDENLIFGEVGLFLTNAQGIQHVLIMYGFRPSYFGCTHKLTKYSITLITSVLSSSKN